MDNILYELRTPVILINKNNIIDYINATGEEFFGHSSNVLLGKSIDSIIQKDSPLLILLSRVRKTNLGLTEESLDISNVNNQNRKVRVHIVPLPKDMDKIIVQISPISVSETLSVIHQTLTPALFASSTDCASLGSRSHIGRNDVASGR